MKEEIQMAVLPPGESLASHECRNRQLYVLELQRPSLGPWLNLERMLS